MKKLISSITSLCLTAAMTAAFVPASASAADASKTFSIKTYDISKPSSADAKSTVTIKKSEIPSSGYVIPSALYFSEGEDNSTESLLVALTTDSKDISFKVYDPAEAYTAGEKEYTINGTTFTSDNYISFAGTYSKLDGYSEGGLYQIAIDSSQTAASTDNYYIGCSWTNSGEDYHWAGEKPDSFPFYVFDTIIPQNIAAGTYSVKYCEYNTDQTGRNYNPCPMVEGQKQRYTTQNGNLKLETMTITVVDDNGSAPTGNADISFSFVDENGSSKINAKPGDEITVFANITANGNPISAMDVQFKAGSSLQITQLGEKSTALGGKKISTNIDEYRANLTSVGTDGEPIVPTDGKAAFSLIVKVPSNAANGDFTIGFDSQCRVFKDSTKYNYTTSFTPLTVSVSGGSDFKLGDVNDDGYVDAVDASNVLAEYARLSSNQNGTFTDKQKLAANVNGDAYIDAVDASNILAYYAYASAATGTVKSMEEYMNK